MIWNHPIETTINNHKQLVVWSSREGTFWVELLKLDTTPKYNQPPKFHISPLKNDGTGRRSGFLLGPGQFLGAYGKLPGSIDGIEKKSYTTYDTWNPLKIEFVHPFVEDPYVTPDAVLAYKRWGVQKWKIREWWLSKSSTTVSGCCERFKRYRNDWHRYSIYT